MNGRKEGIKSVLPKVMKNADKYGCYLDFLGAKKLVTYGLKLCLYRPQASNTDT